VRGVGSSPKTFVWPQTMPWQILARGRRHTPRSRPIDSLSWHAPVESSLRPAITIHHGRTSTNMDHKAPSVFEV
jgi:hypothetical protein